MGPKLKLLKEHFGDSRKQEYDEGVAFLVGFRTCLDFEGREEKKKRVRRRCDRFQERARLRICTAQVEKIEGRHFNHYNSKHM